jgi:hypothetical protein
MIDGDREHTMDELLTELSQLARQYQEIREPYRAQIQACEMACEMVTADILFQIETREALLRPFILAAKATMKVPYLTAVYQSRDRWDSGILFTLAKELPAIMQAYEDASFVQFRKTAR